MKKKSKSAACCDVAGALNPSGFQVEAVVSIDERGQMVLPKDVRSKVGIEPGQKLAIVSVEAAGRTCCLCLIRTEDMAGLVREMLGPMVGELAR